MTLNSKLEYFNMTTMFSIVSVQVKITHNNSKYLSFHKFVLMKTAFTILGLYLLSKPLSIPGTNYCGPGGLQSKDDQTLYPGTDNCCKQHDHCPEQIARFTKKFELYNFCPYTLSLCECDMEFLRCLKDDGSLMSTKVGQLYFNVLQMPCFKLTEGSICKQKTFWGRCIEEIEGQIAELNEPQEF